MSVVVADTGPLHYLVLIEAIDLLPRLFGTVFVPEIVCAELDHDETPAIVRRWITNPPPWLVIRAAPAGAVYKTPNGVALDDGESEALALASALRAGLILMDDRIGVEAARAEGFKVMGTLGVLDLAARRDMMDLADAIVRLRATNFRCQQAIIDDVLARYEADRKSS